MRWKTLEKLNKKNPYTWTTYHSMTCSGLLKWVVFREGDLNIERTTWNESPLVLDLSDLEGLFELLGIKWQPPQFIKNIIGSLLGYGTCGCGKTWWWGTWVSVSYNISTGRGYCSECYIVNKEQFDKENRYWEEKRSEYHSKELKKSQGA